MFNIKNLFKKKTENQPERRIEFFKKKFRKAEQKKVSAQERKQRLKDYLERAGIEVNTKRLFRLFLTLPL